MMALAGSRKRPVGFHTQSKQGAVPGLICRFQPPQLPANAGCHRTMMWW